MAQAMQTLAYFRCRGNDKAPLFNAQFQFDVEQMRKHPDFFECDADGVALDGKVVAVAKVTPEAEEKFEVRSQENQVRGTNPRPAKSRTLRLGAKTTKS